MTLAAAFVKVQFLVFKSGSSWRYTGPLVA
jgi:hypothetical protein